LNHRRQISPGKLAAEGVPSWENVGEGGTKRWVVAPPPTPSDYLLPLIPELTGSTSQQNRPPPPNIPPQVKQTTFSVFFSRDIISIFIISPVTVQIIIIGASRNRNNDFFHGQGERERKIAKMMQRDQTTGGHETHTHTELPSTQNEMK
jgi:hypothetical protein